MAVAITKIEGIDKLQGLTPLLGGKVVTFSFTISDGANGAATITDGDVTMKMVPIWSAINLPPGVIVNSIYPEAPGALGITVMNRSGGDLADQVGIVAYVLLPSNHLFIND